MPAAAAVDLSTCVLAGDDLDATVATVAAVRGLGPVVLAVPQDLAAQTRAALSGAVPAQRGASDAVQVVEIDLGTTVAQAWNAVLAAAPTDVCLLLHAGEILVAGRPGPGEVFTAATVVEQTEMLTGPERLTNVRVLDRSRCRFTGALRPLLEVGVDGEAPAPQTGPGGTVVVDLGARVGPRYAAWLQFTARHLDATTDAAELVDLAAMLAATGEVDAALVRLLAVHGALDGELGHRAARLMTVLAQRHCRLHEVELGAAEWERLSPNPGPARALHGLALFTVRRSGEAADLLEEALADGLLDSDGVTVDRGWVLSARHEARAASQRSASVLPRAFSEIDAVLATEQATSGVIDLWIQTGKPLSLMLEKVTGKRRAALVEALMRIGARLGSRRCLDLAAYLWRGDQDAASTLLQLAAASGGITVQEAVGWSRRLRAAGRSAACPLPLLAAGIATPPVTRVLAAAALIHDLHDDRGKTLLQAAALDLHPAAMDGAMARLRVQAPDLEELLT